MRRFVSWILVVNIFSVLRHNTLLYLCHDTVFKYFITVDDPFCSLGGCFTYQLIQPTKNPLIRSDEYPKRSRNAGCPDTWRRNSLSKSDFLKRSTSKQCFWIESKGDPRAFRGCVDFPWSPRALSAEKWCWKSQVPTLAVQEWKINGTSAGRYSLKHLPRRGDRIFTR